MTSSHRHANSETFTATYDHQAGAFRVARNDPKLLENKGGKNDSSSPPPQRLKIVLS
ncbi:MAG: hypothetical protein AAGG48_22010 [Planctomycetota bacterium]